jgi:protein TonB
MIDLPPMPVPLPAPVPPPPPVFPKPPEPEPELIKEPEPEIVPPKPDVVLPPKPKPKPVQKKVEAPPQPEFPPTPMPAVPVPAPVAAPPMPAVVAPSVAPSYEGLVMAVLQRHKRYPRAALVRGLQGIPTVRFTVARDGTLLSFALERSCGHRLLDDEVLATIQRAAPLPPFPVEMAQAQQEFVVPVRFELQR